MTESKARRISIAVASAYSVLVVVALIITLVSLSDHDFDGLNNVLQIPLALPWWLIVPAPPSHTADAWVTAGLGLVNAVLVYFGVHRVLRARSPA